MLHTSPSLAASPTNLPRRYPTRQHNAYDQLLSDSSYGAATLDLSVNWPNLPYTCNRFDILAPSHFASIPKHDARSARRRRRPRKNGSSSEGRRRDYRRRRRRRWATHLLDEQLSMQIDETLTRANFPLPQSQSLTQPNPDALSASILEPVNALVRYNHLPPRLPSFDFSKFNVPGFEDLTTSRPTKVPTSPLLAAHISNWYTPASNFRFDDPWPHALPTYFDLSSLPEPQAIGSQSFRTSCDGFNPKTKRSRFFQLQSSPAPVVRLPGTECTLYRSDGGFQASDHFIKDLRSTSIKTRDAVEEATTTTESTDEEARFSSAANLWRILASSPLAQTTPKVRTCHRSTQTYFDNQDPETKNARAMASELTGADIPYVHANSLVGYANILASHRGLKEDECNALTGSDAAFATLTVLGDALATGLTGESSMGVGIAGSTDALSPPNTPAPILAELADTSSFPRADYVGTSETTTQQDDLASPSAHYRSEQELFSAPTPQSPCESICDLATFLAMGHVEHCWCRDWDEEITLVDEDDCHPEEDQDWLTWEFVANVEDSCLPRPTADSPKLDFELIHVSDIADPAKNEALSRTSSGQSTEGDDANHSDGESSSLGSND